VYQLSSLQRYGIQPADSVTLLNYIYRVFIAQADLTFILPSELLPKELRQYVVPRGGLFLGKWRSTFAGSSDSKINVRTTCTQNILYMSIYGLYNDPIGIQGPEGVALEP
jgi:hypothetical protein